MNEQDNSRSMSDKDRDMARRFGGEANELGKERDDDDEKKEKKDNKRSQTKIPRKLLLEADKAVEEQPREEKKLPKRAIFPGLVSKEAAEEQSENERPIQEQLEKKEDSSEQAISEEFEAVVEQRIDEVEKEIETVMNPDDAAEVVADAAFLQTVGERIDEDLPPAEAIESALEELELPPVADASAEDLENEANFSGVEDDEEEPSNPQTPVTRPPAPASPPPTPPLVPVPPLSPPPPRPPSPPIMPGPSLPPNPNTGLPNMNVPSAPNVAPQPASPNIVQMNSMYYRNRRSGDLLLGGVIGYMLGRRGGRKRTEARLMPEIEERDKALGELKTKLTDSEAEVRALAAKEHFEKAEKKTDVVEKRVEIPAYERIVEKVEEVAETNIAAERAAIEKEREAFEEKLEQSEMTAAADTVESTREILERTFATETIPVPVPVPELSAENTIKTETLRRVERERATPESKDVRFMTVPELLEVADHIYLEKTSVRQLYERGRIDAVNLRRVVIEYMQGGQQYERVLRGSLEAVEMQRELRNEVRHDPGAFSNASSGGAGADNNSSGSGFSSVPLVSADSFKKELSKGSASQKQSTSILNEQEDDRILLSNGTAIALGILAGIVIMILLFLYGSSI